MNFPWMTLWQQAYPLLILLGMALICMLTAAFKGKTAYAVTAILTILAFAVSSFLFFFEAQNHWMSQSFFFLHFDAYSRWIAGILCLIGLVTSFISYPYLKHQAERINEYFALLLFSVVGMVLMLSTTHLLMFVLGLEIMSISLYVLVGLRRYELVSSEAAFKYFLLGSVATAFLLFGIALFYGSTGSLDLKTFATVPKDLAGIYQWGAILILLGFIFKVAAVPLQFWAPDVYDGAPMPVTGFMSTGVKIAAFGALIRFLEYFAHFEIHLPLSRWLGFFAVLTLIVSNIAALRQKALKRILAYSSISHAGYLLLGLVPLVGGDSSYNLAAQTPLLFYFASYSLLTLGVFAVLTCLSSGGEEFSTLDHLDGLADRNPILAALLSLFLISLAGIPPTVGFFAKYLLFRQVLWSGNYILAVIAILMSAVSLFYYLAPVVRMYFRGSEKSYPMPRVNWVLRGLLGIMALAVFYFGLFPAKLMKAPHIISPADAAHKIQMEAP